MSWLDLQMKVDNGELKAWIQGIITWVLTVTKITTTQLYADYTNSATIGDVTINKMAGRCNIAAGAATITVTNSLVTAASKIFCSIAVNDTTAILKNVIPGVGSFTIKTTANVTANCAVDFFVVNTD